MFKEFLIGYSKIRFCGYRFCLIFSLSFSHKISNLPRNAIGIVGICLKLATHLLNFQLTSNGWFVKNPCKLNYQIKVYYFVSLSICFPELSLYPIFLAFLKQFIRILKTTYRPGRSFSLKVKFFRNWIQNYSWLHPILLPWNINCSAHRGCYIYSETRDSFSCVDLINQAKYIKTFMENKRTSETFRLTF